MLDRRLASARLDDARSVQGRRRGSLIRSIPDRSEFSWGRGTFSPLLTKRASPILDLARPRRIEHSRGVRDHDRVSRIEKSAGARRGILNGRLSVVARIIVLEGTRGGRRVLTNATRIQRYLKIQGPGEFSRSSTFCDIYFRSAFAVRSR